MKINSIGIQSYQEMVRRDNAAQRPDLNAETKKADGKVAIEPHNRATRSQMAVKAPKGSYSEFLSVEERQALELLFSRFKGNENVAASADAGSKAPTLGAWIDVKA